MQERVDELQRAINVVTKRDKQEQPKTGRMIGDYSVNSSLEFGYRWTDVNGSREKFLSDVNIREGLRLFNYSLDSRSVTGAGSLYDFMHAEASGVGGDPQQTLALRMDKKRAYKFDASVRRLYYFRYLPNFSMNSHNIDTRQQVSDFSLKLFPQRKVRVNLGYDRAMQTGFSQLTTYTNSDVFVDPGNRRWESNNYRLGIDATHRGWDFFAEQMYRTYKWDTSYAWPGGVNPGVVGPNDLSTITFFTRPEATRSHGSVTRGSLAGSLAKRIHLVARGMYSEERMDGFLIESYAGTAPAANTKNPVERLLVERLRQTSEQVFRRGAFIRPDRAPDAQQHVPLFRLHHQWRCLRQHVSAAAKPQWVNHDDQPPPIRRLSESSHGARLLRHARD